MMGALSPLTRAKTWCELIGCNLPGWQGRGKQCLREAVTQSLSAFIASPSSSACTPRKWPC